MARGWLRRTTADAEAPHVWRVSDATGSLTPMSDTPAPLSPRQFHAESGTEGWHVLYGGAQTIFPTGSFETGAAFVAAIIAALDGLDREPDLDLRSDIVAVVTARNRRGRLDTLDAEVARRVTAVAARLGLEPDPTRLSTVQIAVAQADRVDTSAFWLAALGYERVDDTVADPLRRWPRLWFDEIDRTGRGRTHIDVAVPTALAPARVDAALAAGGRIGRDDSVPEWWGLVSPEGHLIDVAAWGDSAGGPQGADSCITRRAAGGPSPPPIITASISRSGRTCDRRGAHP